VKGIEWRADAITEANMTITEPTQTNTTAIKEKLYTEYQLAVLMGYERSGSNEPSMHLVTLPSTKRC
jgi:hypothetical protein